MQFFWRPGHKFQLHNDTSAIVLGAVLQLGGKVVAYASRTLTRAERNYSIIQHECIAIIYVCIETVPPLPTRQTNFTLHTDHVPLY